MGTATEESLDNDEHDIITEPENDLDEMTVDVGDPQATTAESVERDVSSSVLVAVRVRPLLAMEDGTDLCLRVMHSPHNDLRSLQVAGGGPRFTYDHVFDLNASQEQIYATCVAPLVESCLMGYNATVFAYGQTGSGKTYTIMGEEGSECSVTSAGSDASAGVIPRAIQALFDRLDDDEKMTVRIQFLEIYGEEIRDLLTNNHAAKLSIRDVGTDGEPEVQGATQKQVSNAAEALRALTHGKLRRVTGATAMNEASSRSHAILSVLIEQSIVLDEGDAQGNNQHVQIKRSKFNFVGESNNHVS
jgi:kinesin family member 27